MSASMLAKPDTITKDHNIDYAPFPASETAQSIMDRFAKQLQLHPHNLAIKTNNSSWDYLTFNRQIDKIGNAIIEQLSNIENLPANTGQRIALMTSSSEWALAALFAILKTGNVYVPIDPSYPKNRIEYIFAEANVPLILTESKYLDLISALTNQPVINIENINSSASTSNKELAFIKQSPDDLAYIIYTSGSTGQPKGVMQSHRNLLHFIRNYSNGLKITANDRLTFFYSLSFSASLMDIFSSLLNGAALFPYAVKESGIEHLAAFLEREKITVYHSVPTLFRHFLATLSENSIIETVRIIDLGGETVYPKDVDLFRKYFKSSCILVNHLAATEISVIAQYFIDDKTEIDGAIVPVGRASSETNIELWDEAGKPVAIGEVGELVIKSRYLSSGYWQKAELTNSVITNHSDGTRTYRSGDMGRWRNDGHLEYLGRRDFRIKIRGHSIETAEVETALLALGNIKESVVTAQPDPQGELQLVAYYVLKQRPGIPKDILRIFLRDKLPEYMIPSIFVELTMLPLTPNGKVDTKALPPPNWQKPIDTPYVEPRNRSEIEMQKIWQSVLKISQIGIHDDFFSLGGTSLHLLKLLAKVESQFKIKLSPSAIFQTATIEKLVQKIEGKDIVNATITVFQAHGSRPILFGFPGVNGDSFIFRNMALQMGIDQPIYGFQYPWQTEWKTPYKTLKDLTREYKKMIVEIQKEGPYYLIGFSFGGIMALDVAQQLLAEGQKVGTVVLLDTYGPTFLKKRPAKERFKVHINNFTSVGVIGKLKYIKRQIRKNIVTISSNFLVKAANRFPDSNYVNKFLSNAHPFVHVGRLRNNYQFNTYPGRVDLFRATKQNEDYLEDPLLGWGNLLTGLNITHIPGNHDSITRDDVSALTDQLKRLLNQLQN